MSDSTLAQLRARFEASPGDRAAFEALEEQLFVRGEWAPLVALYDDRLAAPEVAADGPDAGRRERARVLFRKGQVLEERRLEADRAIDCYREVLDLDPGFRPALQQLRGLFARREDWDEVLLAAERESAIEMPAPERARFATEVGEIYEQRLSDAEQALVQYEDALQADPDHVAALLGAARAHVSLGAPRAAAAALERATERLRGADRAPALVAWAELCEGELGEADRAPELYRRALTDDPRCERALESLSWEAGRSGNWEMLDDLCERRFEVATGAVRRLAIAHEAARGQLEGARNPRAARHWLDRAESLFGDDPVVPMLRADCEGLAGDRKAREPHLRRALALAGDAIPESVLRECAELAMARGDGEQAAQDFQALLARTGPVPETLEPFEEVLAELGRDDELDELLVLAAGSAGGTQRTELWLRLASLREQREDADSAREALENAARTDPGHPEVCQRLESIYRADADGSALRTHLERSLAAATEPARQVALRCALGDQALDAGDEDAAQSHFEAALVLSADEPRARQGLERIALASGDPASIAETFEAESRITTDPERLRFLCTELTRIHRELDAPERALDACQRLLEHVPDHEPALRAKLSLEEALGHDDERLATLTRLEDFSAGADLAALRRDRARLLEARNDLDGCIDALNDALRADPDDRESLCALLGPLETRARHAERADVLRRLAADAPAEHARELRVELAVLLEEQLGDAAGAIDVLEALVESGQAPEETLPRLERLLERTGRDRALEALLARRRALLDAGGAEALALDRRRAELLAGPLDRPDEAADLLLGLREALPEEAALGEQLERALRAARRHDALAELLAERAANERDPERRSALELERADLLATLGEHDASIALLGELAERGGVHGLAAESRIDASLERGGAFEALAERLEARLDQVPLQERVAVHEWLVHLYRDRLQDPQRAADHLDAAARRARDRVDLWQALVQLHDREGCTASVRDAIEGELGCALDTHRARGLHARAATISLDLGEPDKAARHYEALLAIDPAHDEAAEFVIDRLEREERHADLAAALDSRIAALCARDGAEDSGVLALRLRLAALHAGPQNAPERAAAILEPLANDGTLAIVAEPLAELYERLARPAPLADLARHAAAASDDKDERARWLYRAGVALRAAGQGDEAIGSFERALAERPDDVPARAALRDLHRELGQAEPLARLLEADLPEAGGAEELAIRRELAELQAGALGRPAEALAHLRRALVLAPGHRETLDRALALAEQQERHDEWLELADEALALGCAPDRRGALLARAGTLLLERGRDASAPDADDVGGRTRAIALLRQATVLRPDDTDLRPQLRDALTRDLAQASPEREPEARNALLAFLEQEAAACADDPARAVALCEEGAALAGAHGDGDATLPWLARLRALAPDDPTLPARCAEVHRAADRRDALLRAIEAELDLEIPRERRVALLVERAQCLELAFDAPAAAVESLEEARSLDPDAPALLEALDRLFAALARHGERDAVLARRIAVAGSDREACCALLRERATLARQTGRPADAAVHHFAVLTQVADPERPAALRAFGDALAEAGRTDLWARAAEAELAGLATGDDVLSERRRALHEALARACAGPLGRPDAARAHWRALLDQGLAPAGSALAREAEDALLMGLRRTGDVIALESRLATRLEREGEAGTATAWLELGRLRLERLHRPTGACNAFEAALERDPACLAAIRGLRQASERLGRMGVVADSLDAELATDAAQDPALRTALGRRLGEVAWRHLGDTPRARAAFETALEASPEDLGCLRALEDLAESSEDHTGALATFHREIEVLGDREPERRTTAWLRCAEIERDHLENASAALAAFASAEQAAPIDLESRRAWANLLEAEGETETFARVFAVWCDDSNEPVADDWLRLANALAEIGRGGEALERAERAAEVGAERTDVWDRVAELAEAEGDVARASEALERGAETVAGREAATRRLAAGRVVEDHAPERAFDLLFRASCDDAAHPGVQAALARVAVVVDRDEVAHRAAARALEVDGADPLAAELRLATALLGAQAARRCVRLGESAQLLESALRLEPSHEDALAWHGEVRFELGDFEAAARSLTARLEADEEDPARPQHLALLGEALVRCGDRAAGCDRLREALALDGDLDRAHQALAAALEAASREGERSQVPEAVTVLCTWAARAEDDEDRGVRLARAAELELLGGVGEAAAESLFRQAVAAAPGAGAAWSRLASLLQQQGRGDDALETCSTAITAIDDGVGLADLHALRGGLLADRGQALEAARDWQQAAQQDPERGEAALEAARLYREQGDWNLAAAVLRDFAEAVPESARSQAAAPFHELGRLLAGPLEDLPGAIDAHRHALEADPQLEAAHEALASLLVHRPEHWNEAVRYHAALLQDDPIRLASLRALAHVAEGRGVDRASAGLAAILRALGVATSAECALAPARPPGLTEAVSAGLPDPLEECARQLAVGAAEEISEALGGSAGSGARAGDAVSRLRAAIAEQEAALSAPGLVALPPEEVGAAIALVARLAEDRTTVRADGHLVNALGATLGRRALRRARRTLDTWRAEDIAQIDWTDFRVSLRSLAAMAALEAEDAQLRTAFLAWLGEGDEARAIADESDLRARVAACPEARDLLVRLIEACVRALGAA